MKRKNPREERNFLKSKEPCDRGSIPRRPVSFLPEADCQFEGGAGFGRTFTALLARERTGRDSDGDACNLCCAVAVVKAEETIDVGFYGAVEFLRV